MPGQPQVHLPRPGLTEPTAQGALWCPCLASPADRPWPVEGADATAVATMMDHRHIDMGEAMILLPRKDQTVNRSGVDGCLTL